MTLKVSLSSANFTIVEEIKDQSMSKEMRSNHSVESSHRAMEENKKAMLL
jgi:hypothetical protein